MYWLSPAEGVVWVEGWPWASAGAHTISPSATELRAHAPMRKRRPTTDVLKQCGNPAFVSATASEPDFLPAPARCGRDPLSNRVAVGDCAPDDRGRRASYAARVQARRCVCRIADAFRRFLGTRCARCPRMPENGPRQLGRTALCRLRRMLRAFPRFRRARFRRARFRRARATS
jgi:hypothetical protein